MMLRTAVVILLAGIAPVCAGEASAFEDPAAAAEAPALEHRHLPASVSLAFADRPSVAPEVLASMRGGFTGSVGGELLEMSFGIERVVSVNGDIVGTTRFRLPSLRLDSVQSASLLQSGSGNHVATDIARNIPLQVIQNTLDNQVLRQVTTIDASVRNLELFRAVQFGATLNRQLFMSVR
jgi:hypothetical protein